MNSFTSSIVTRIALLLFAFGLALSTSACAQDSDMKRAGNKNEKQILGKIKSGGKLSSTEINNLGGVYLLNKQYSAGFETFERLGNDDKYKNEKYLIDLNLAKFYLQQSSENTSGANKAILIEKAKSYLNQGVASANEKATGLYVRAQIYGYEGCIEKARKDLQDARSIAQGKELILYEDGVYLTRDKFLSLIQRNLDSLSRLTDSCELN